MSYEEEDTCLCSERVPPSAMCSGILPAEEDTCMSYEEEDTCLCSERVPPSAMCSGILPAGLDLGFLD